ncbi:UNKNOWN [Stylonychia lemnae]|uniref:Uncharacterized protein n=1 Tax=Stylonychia lemnae TaxID=5949 RepID=A0A077ZVG1_STYLE|nr:UNKNOWN [Stylonychia lemnae]|eukprot:CDW73619.1 UNKNOWN [Stylonychia lemnae]
MEILQSKSDYFECELDPNEFRKPKVDHHQSYTETLQELPYKCYALLFTILYFVVSPVTLNQVYSKARKQYKKTRRNMRMKYVRVRKYGLFNSPQKQAKQDDFTGDTCFITDKMLSESEDESDNDEQYQQYSSKQSYESPKKYAGIFSA